MSIEFTRPSQPISETIVPFVDDHLRAQLEAKKQQEADKISGRNLTPLEIISAAAVMKELDNGVDDAIRELKRAFVRFSDRLEDLGLELPNDHELAQVIIEGKYFESPKSAPSLRRGGIGSSEWDSAWGEEAGELDFSHLPGLEEDDEEISPVTRARYLRTRAKPRPVRWLTEKKAQVLKQKIDFPLDDGVYLRSLYNWRSDEGSMTETPDEWITFMNSLNPQDKGVLRRVLGFVISGLKQSKGDTSPNYDLRPFTDTLGDLKKLLAQGPESLGPTKMDIARFFIEFFSVTPGEASA